MMQKKHYFVLQTKDEKGHNLLKQTLDTPGVQENSWWNGRAKEKGKGRGRGEEGEGGGEEGGRRSKGRVRRKEKIRNRNKIEGAYLSEN